MLRELRFGGVLEVGCDRWWFAFLNVGWLNGWMLNVGRDGGDDGH